MASDTDMNNFNKNIMSVRSLKLSVVCMKHNDKCSCYY